MLAVSLQQGRILIENAAVPQRPPGFALLQLILAGICNTDLELQRGYYNFQGTPGHEFVARVIECDNPAVLNKRVVGEINIACEHCDFCAKQLGRHCRNRSVLGILKHPGAFAEYFTLPETNLHVVPDAVPDREAVFVEPLAAACEILDQVNLAPGTEVAILGDGKLGLLITQVLLAHDLKVTLYGHHQAKLQIAQAAGAETSTSADLPKSAYPCVVECTGSAHGLAAAIQMVRPRGTVVMKSTVHDRVSLDMAPVIVNEISLVGSRCGRFEPALALLESAKGTTSAAHQARKTGGYEVPVLRGLNKSRSINVAPLISAEFPLAQAPRAFELAATSGVLKVLLTATLG